MFAYDTAVDLNECDQTPLNGIVRTKNGEKRLEGLVRPGKRRNKITTRKKTHTLALIK